MNPSTRVVAPLAVDRNTFLAPSVPAGVVTKTDVELSTTIEVPATPPNRISEVPERLLPVTRTVLPPKVLPVAAEMLETFGASVIAPGVNGVSI